MGWVRAAKSRTAPAKAGRETRAPCERLLLKADHNLGLAGRNLKINATLAVGSEGRVEVDCGHWNRALPPALLHLQRVNRQNIVTGFDSLSIGKNEHWRQSRLREGRVVARFRLLANRHTLVGASELFTLVERSVGELAAAPFAVNLGPQRNVDLAAISR